MSHFTPPPQRAAWQHLETLRPLAESMHLRDLLQDPQREPAMALHAAGIDADFSRQRVNATVLQQLFALAEESQVMAQAQAMFRGEHINATEDRAVLHVALRGGAQANPPWGAAIAGQVRDELQRVCAFAELVRAGGLKGFSGQAITDVVNLGIGGSDLGPRMCTEALTPVLPDATTAPVRVHYVSNVDGWSLHGVLRTLDPARTAFIVQSKTFTTQETMTLAASARRWLRDGGSSEAQLTQHLIAVTAKPALAQAQGFAPERIFGFWDWVGGRYSVWSAIGLPLAMAIGASAFEQMLAGGRAMDDHFIGTPVEQNLPLRLALMGVWNRNFLGADTHHVAPYAWPLLKLVPFLQQMDMESNGKRIHIDGSVAEVGTGPILWGGLGIDGQHAYFQLLHQGRHLVPVDFIGVRDAGCPLPLAEEHQRIVLLNLRAQAQALALGRTPEATETQLRAEGLSAAEAQRLAPHRSYPGNVPSTTLWMDRLTPHSLGALIALYEHKVFCQAAIWGIHAFDQWGVELGKKMVKEME